MRYLGLVCAVCVTVVVGCSAARHDEVLVTSETSEQPRLGLPAAFSKLGASCSAELASGSSFVCGHDHRIASLTVPFQSLPHGGTLRYRKDEPPGAMSSATIEIDGPHVWMENGCRYCRLMVSSTTVADLRLIDDEGLSNLQNQAGLPRSPLLRTASAWVDATSTWEQKRYD